MLDNLEKENEKLKLENEQMKNILEKGIPTTMENMELKMEILKLKSDIKNLVSLNLWSARRMGNTINKNYIYNEVENVTGETYERL